MGAGECFELTDLSVLRADLERLDFTAKELAKVLHPAGSRGLIDENKASEPPKKAVISGRYIRHVRRLVAVNQNRGELAANADTLH